MTEEITRFNGLVLKNHVYSVPLDHDNPDGEKIEIFAREVVAREKEDEDLPVLLFLQGGPGFPSPRPPNKSGWLKRALKEFKVLFLDDRGTGKSAPVTFQTLAKFKSPQEQADYLKLFRADAIVKDCEIIRKKLLGKKTWSVLGQSYGGFCITHYLSAAPEGLKEVFLCGGLPITEGEADRVYRHTYPRMIIRNKIYYERYPEDVPKVKEIVKYLQENEVILPTGGHLTARMFQLYGIHFGFDGGYESLHYMVDEAFVEGASGRELSFGFQRAFENSQSFDTNPIFAILHESIYCNQFSSRWACERVHADFPEFAIDQSEQPFYFVGEMIYSWMFDDFKYLRPIKEAAEILASFKDWPHLYDFDVLAKNTVPCAAAMYYDDMFVERKFSEETALKIKGTKLYVTNEYDHGGLRLGGEKVLDRLIDLARGEKSAL
jgi:pimeloyl-ACP methyl ester carboxylesterase